MNIVKLFKSEVEAKKTNRKGNKIIQYTKRIPAYVVYAQIPYLKSYSVT